MITNVFANYYHKLNYYKKDKVRYEPDWLKKYHHIKQYIIWFNTEYYPKEISNCESKNKLNLLVKRHKQLLLFENIIDSLIVLGVSINEWFKTNKRAKLSKSQFYNLRKEILFYADREHDRIGSFLGKNPIPKNPKSKYTEFQKYQIQEYTYKCLINRQYYDYTSIWLTIRKENKLSNYGDFSQLSLSSFKRILKKDKRFETEIIKKYKPKHEFRKHVKEIGIIQADIKILGKYECQVHNKKPEIFSMIDMSTRVVFSKVLKTSNVESVLAALNEGKTFFKSLGIEMKAIQTDNAMMFKSTNFVKHHTFSKWCYDNKIIQRHIPLKQAQSNGTIEKYHQTIDKEIHHKLIHCYNLDQIANVINEWQDYYNFKRYHSYQEMKDKKYVDRFYTPFDSINVIREYNVNSGLSKKI